MKIRKKSCKLFCVILSLIMLLSQTADGVTQKTKAAQKDTALLRILFTTDLHGQVNDVDYSTGKAYPRGGLAKDVTLIKKAKAEAGADNTVIFDLGDAMYDFLTDYVYDSQVDTLQPIYAAMSKVGYDAITMGNHEFEYTTPYISKQLQMAGLQDKVVVSNVTSALTGEHIWSENKIIEKQLQTVSGKRISVKIGVIGETIPTLSKKRYDYTGELVGQDIVENVKEESQKLRSQGADIIVVLAHSGIGSQNPQPMDENVCYALTQISQVDVVLSGHEHSYFCADGSTVYDDYPGVDTKNHLVNEKNLVQIANRGQSVGQVDLQIVNEGGTAYIDSRSQKINKVTNDTVSDAEINAQMDSIGPKLLEEGGQILCELAPSVHMTNYYGTIEDSGVMQLLNDIGISYGLYYKNEENKDCKDLPIVAGAVYNEYGSGGGEDYFDISGNFTRANLYQLMTYRLQYWRYKVSGAQLREMLEYGASAYETAGNNILNEETPQPTEVVTESAISGITAKSGETTTEVEETVNPSATPEQSPEVSVMPDEVENDEQFDEQAGAQSGSDDELGDSDMTEQIPVVEETEIKDLIQDLIYYDGAEPIQYLLQKNWRTNWYHYFIFDGIEYQIDNTKAPRYSLSGKKINDTHRIVSMTRNGVPIGDNEEFLLILNRLPGTTLPDQFTTADMGHTSAANTRQYVEEYLIRESETGTMKDMVDHNWKVTISPEYQYIVKTGDAAENIENPQYIQDKLLSLNGYSYYKADFKEWKVKDQTGPALTLKALNDEETNHDVTVAVQATDSSGIASVKYVAGKYTADSTVWSHAAEVNSSFVCTSNIVYSVLAIDKAGNKTMRYIRINNINRSVLQAPVVNTYTNRKSYIEGTAEPGATIYFELENDEVYKTKVNDDGTFKYKLTPQNAGAKVYVYVKDIEGRASSRTVVVVKRTGPNKPVMDSIMTNSKQVTGDFNDTNVYPVFFDADKKVAYVPDDKTIELYKKSEMYDASYELQVLSMDITKDGRYTFNLPKLMKSKKILMLRTFDLAARNSMSTSRKVVKTVPAKPSISGATNLSKKIKIFTEEKCTSAVLTVGKKIYTIKKATYVKSKDWYRYEKKIARTDSGVKVQAYLTNSKGKGAVCKTTKKEVVPDTPTMKKPVAGKKKITGHVDIVGDDTLIDGITVENSETEVLVYVNGKKKSAEINFEGKYTLKLKNKLKSGDRITVKGRNLYGTGLSRTKKVK